MLASFGTMRSSLVRSLVIAVVLVLAPVAARAQTSSTNALEESVRAAEMARRDALLKADTVALSRLIAPEFYEVTRLGTVRARAENLREISTGDLRLLTIRYDSTVVHVYGDVAILSAVADNTGMFHGNAFSGKIRYTRVFVRRDGRWQAVMMQQTPMP